MNEYTASNGAVVKWSGVNGCVHRLDVGLQPVELDLSEWQALREFFQAETDERLGRWRDPRWPDFVAYPIEGSPQEVRIVNERSAVRRDYRLGSGALTVAGPTEWRAFSDAYFAAHPEPKPAWGDAKPGEVWSVTTDRRSGEAWTLDGGAFMFDDEGFVRSSEITAAHRIYPPMEES